MAANGAFPLPEGVPLRLRVYLDDFLHISRIINSEVEVFYDTVSTIDAAVEHPDLFAIERLQLFRRNTRRVCASISSFMRAIDHARQMEILLLVETLRNDIARFFRCVGPVRTTIRMQLLGRHRRQGRRHAALWQFDANFRAPF